MAKTVPQKPSNRRRSPRRKERMAVELPCRQESHGLGPDLALNLLDISNSGVRLVMTQSLEVMTDIIDGYAMKEMIKNLGTDTSARLTGYSPNEAVGRIYQVLNTSETDRSQIDTIRMALATWQPARLEFLAQRKDGSAFWAELNIVPLADKTGRYSHWVVIQRDISEQKTAEEALRRAKEAAEEANRETRFLHLQLQGQNHLLDVKVRERTRDLEEARIEILQRLSQAAEFRDDDTGQHTQRVGRVSALLARALGLPDDLMQLIRLAAPLHDVGKIGISDAILLKPGALTPDEFRVMTTHTSIGSRILSGSQSPLLQLAAQIALTHHECWDGSGYPLGSRGERIPLAGRIVTVADVFDALTHPRSYKKAWTAEAAATEIERLSGSKFDSRVVEAFLQLLQEGLIQEDVAGGTLARRIGRTIWPVHGGARLPD